MDAKSPGSPFLVILDHWATCTASLPLKATEIILQPGRGSVLSLAGQFGGCGLGYSTTLMAFASQSLLKSLWLGIQPIQVLVVSSLALGTPELWSFGAWQGGCAGQGTVLVAWSLSLAGNF